MIGRFETLLAALEQLTAAHDALRRYGRHADGCVVMLWRHLPEQARNAQAPPCNCGWDFVEKAMDA